MWQEASESKGYEVSVEILGGCELEGGCCCAVEIEGSEIGRTSVDHDGEVRRWCCCRVVSRASVTATNPIWSGAAMRAEVAAGSTMRFAVFAANGRLLGEKSVVLVREVALGPRRNLSIELERDGKTVGTLEVALRLEGGSTPKQLVRQSKPPPRPPPKIESTEIIQLKRSSRSGSVYRSATQHLMDVGASQELVEIVSALADIAVDFECDDVQDCRVALVSRGLRFVDATFPPSDATWRRLPQASSGARPDWLSSTASVVGRDLAYDASGLYRVRLCFGGLWRTVTIDDFVPFPDACEVALLRKALAKCLGSYDALRSYRVDDALASLTGNPVLSTNNFLQDQCLVCAEKDGIAFKVLGVDGDQVRLEESNCELTWAIDDFSSMFDRIYAVRDWAFESRRRLFLAKTQPNAYAAFTVRSTSEFRGIAAPI